MSDASMPATSPPPQHGPGGAITVVRLDFRARSEAPVTLDEVSTQPADGVHFWVDVDATAADARAVLERVGIPGEAIAEALGPDVDGRHDLYDECLHTAVTERVHKDGTLGAAHVDIILARHATVTVRRGRAEFLETVRRRYRADFVKFARSPSFLLHEFFDCLIQGFRRSMASLGDHAEHLQHTIFEEVDDTIFNEVAGITQDLLMLRKSMMGVRDVLHELATHRSDFVAESAQPFLDRMTDAMERLVSDVGVTREVLSESLNLYMGMVSHRTNAIVKRLTVVSVIFMPLTFLCGVYGMNFEPALMPELSWQHGYHAFWVAVVTITGTLLLFMRRRRWL